MNHLGICLCLFNFILFPLHYGLKLFAIGIIT